MIDPAEANETYRAASAIAAFDATQVAFAALVKKGFCQRPRPNKYSGRQSRTAELLAIALEKISKFEPVPRE
jgi:hypothetical protein